MPFSLQSLIDEENQLTTLLKNLKRLSSADSRQPSRPPPPPPPRPESPFKSFFKDVAKRVLVHVVADSVLPGAGTLLENIFD